MRYLISIALIVFSLSANATHHRGHALYYLERVEAGLANSLNHVQGIRNTNDVLTDFDSAKLDKIANQIIEMQWQVALIDSSLRDCSVNLKDIRRLVNQPKNKFSEHPHAILFTMKHAAYNNGVIISNRTVENEKVLGMMVRALVSTWQHMDFVLWHVNDAIKEEVYQDDQWYGHEPGFDPVTNLGSPYPRANQTTHTEERHWVSCE